jgi:DNA-binding CsgD family transcriptional regulator
LNPEGAQVVRFERNGSVSLDNGSVLTVRELEVLEQMSLGKSNREIADHLFLTIHTVEFYATRIYQKLGVRNRTQASFAAARMGLLGGKLPSTAISRGLQDAPRALQDVGSVGTTALRRIPMGLLGTAAATSLVLVAMLFAMTGVPGKIGDLSFLGGGKDKPSNLSGGSEAVQMTTNEGNDCEGRPAQRSEIADHISENTGLPVRDPEETVDYECRTTWPQELSSFDEANRDLFKPRLPLNLPQGLELAWTRQWDARPPPEADIPPFPHIQIDACFGATPSATACQFGDGSTQWLLISQGFPATGVAEYHFLPGGATGTVPIGELQGYWYRGSPPVPLGNRDGSEIRGREWKDNGQITLFWAHQVTAEYPVEMVLSGAIVGMRPVVVYGGENPGPGPSEIWYSLTSNALSLEELVEVAESVPTG